MADNLKLNESECCNEKEDVSLNSSVSRDDETIVDDNKSLSDCKRDVQPIAPCETPLSRIGVNTDKAGMEGLDKTKINQIILEASKGSKYYKKELEREQALSHRINRMLKQLDKLTESELHRAELASDAAMELLEMRRDLTHVIVHVDMDAFYAAVEMRDDPALRDVPMAVGGSSMLSTSNYLARRYGVRAAMPGFIGKKLCPELIIVKPNFNKYRIVSEEVRSILVDYDPDFSPMGLDEAYLDITEYVNELVTGSGMSPCLGTSPVSDESTGTGLVNDSENAISSSPTETSHDPYTVHDDEGTNRQPNSSTFSSTYRECIQKVVSEIRERICNKTGLTASAGIAPNRMLAKISSNINKPNGQYYLEPDRDRIMEFIQTLPIRKVSGIGKVTEKMLNALGIELCSDIHKKRGVLKLLFSDTASHGFFKISLGLGSTEVNNEWERKSISTERTFPDTNSPHVLYNKCSELCQALSTEVAEEELKGRTVTLKLKTAAFEVKQKSQTISSGVGTYEEIHEIAHKLLSSEMRACPPATPLNLRLMGVRLSNLVRPGLDPPPAKRVNTLEKYFTKQSPTKDGVTITDDGSSTRDEQTTIEDKEMAEDDGTAPQDEGMNETLEDEKVMVQCPVCSVSITYIDNVQFNQHIDECLNTALINDHF